MILQIELFLYLFTLLKDLCESKENLKFIRMNKINISPVLSAISPTPPARALVQLNRWSIISIGYGVFREGIMIYISNCFNRHNFGIHFFLPIQLNQCRAKQDKENRAVDKMMETHECMGVPKSFPSDIWSKIWMS